MVVEQHKTNDLRALKCDQQSMQQMLSFTVDGTLMKSNGLLCAAFIHSG